MQARAVLCDAAGTLFAPACPIADTYVEISARHGAQISRSGITRAFAEVFENAPPMAFPAAQASEIPALEREWWRNIVRQVLTRAAPDDLPGDFDACFAHLFDFFSRASSWRLMDGAPDALDALKARGLRLAIASNFDLRIHSLLSGLRIADRFETVVLPADTRTTKPDPRFFRHALERLGTVAEETIFLGDDRRRDLAGAQAVGMPTVYAPGLATLRDLPNLIEELGETGCDRSIK